MSKEIWRDVIGWEGRYKVSNLGRVKSMKFRHHNKEEILKQESNFNYRRVLLFTEDGQRKHMRVHRLVAEAFIPNPKGYNEINHKNENTNDNRVDNLEWCDHKYNIHYGTRIERVNKKIRKPIIQLDDNNKIIKKYISITQAEQNGYNRSNIIACAKGKIKKAYGYIWKYDIKEPSN